MNKCPICGNETGKVGWLAYAFVYDNTWERRTIDYCCHECLSHIKIMINQLQATHKGRVENIGLLERKP